jgi:hypothetical protein
VAAAVAAAALLGRRPTLAVGGHSSLDTPAAEVMQPRATEHEARLAWLARHELPTWGTAAKKASEEEAKRAWLAKLHEWLNRVPTPVRLDIDEAKLDEWRGIAGVPAGGTTAKTAEEEAKRAWLAKLDEWLNRVPTSVRLNIDELIISDRLGEGAQSEVLRGELAGPVAVKLAKKLGAVDREAAVLSAVQGIPGFPKLLHHEAPGPRAKSGFLVVELLGRSLHDLWQSKSESESTPNRLSGQTLFGVGRGVLNLLRELHYVGFVHNDVKPANVLLGAGSSALQPTRLHLIDFGSCTRAGAQAAPDGPIGTATFASVAADECQRPMRPADDIESLAYVLAFLAGGSLPWAGKPPTHVLSMKRELLHGRSSAAAELADDLNLAPEVAAAFQALWAEVRRCHGDLSSDGFSDGFAGPSVNYEACLAALGGGSPKGEAEADTFSELSFISALSSESSEVEEEAKRVWLVKLDVPTWGAAAKMSEDEAKKAGLLKQDVPIWSI